MNRVAKVLMLPAAFLLVVGGCDAASHIPALQPPKVPASGKITLPKVQVTVVPCVPGSTKQCLESNPDAGTFQRGIDVDWYASRGEDVTADVVKTINWITSEHANAVSVSFPFYLHGTSAVGAGPGTPTPAQLSQFVINAETAGLYVSLRPLMDGHSIGHSRTRWTPASMRVFFTTYWQFLKPYAQMAQLNHAGEFILGTEFVRFSLNLRWTRLAHQVRAVYHGTLACADNWNQDTTARNCGTGVQTVDAYHPAPAGTITAMRAEWRVFDQSLAPGTVETEIGIAAANGAWHAPWNTHWYVPVNPVVQARWFTIACQQAVQQHLHGIYYWSVGLGKPPAVPTYSNQTAIGGPAARAIAACYGRITK